MTFKPLALVGTWLSLFCRFFFFDAFFLLLLFSFFVSPPLWCPSLMSCCPSPDYILRPLLVWVDAALCSLLPLACRVDILVSSVLVRDLFPAIHRLGARMVWCRWSLERFEIKVFMWACLPSQTSADSGGILPQIGVAQRFSGISCIS